MKNDGSFIIYVTERYYWDLSLIPEQNEFDEPINTCILVDSQSGAAIDSLAFDALWLIPIFQNRSQVGMKQLAQKLKEVTDKYEIYATPKDQMPKDKRIKETEKIVKRIIK